MIEETSAIAVTERTYKHHPTMEISETRRMLVFEAVVENYQQYY